MVRRVGHVRRHNHIISDSSLIPIDTSLITPSSTASARSTHTTEEDDDHDLSRSPTSAVAPLTMTAFYHLITPLLAMAMALAVSGFQAPSHRIFKFKYRSAATQSRLNLVRWQEDDGINSLPRASASVRPVLSASTITAAAIIASTPILPARATDSFDMSIISYSNDGLAISDSESIRGSTSLLHPDQYTTNTKSFTSLSSLQLSSSTLANPIGEIQDGSESGSIENSFGQWFFVIYIVVSLLAGGKEMISRIQKQIDKADI
jgi:hypothetical protein